MTTTKDRNQVLCPEWDMADSYSNLEHIRQTTLKKCGCTKSKCITHRCKCKVSGSYCTNSCTCKECENKPHNQVADDKGVDECEEDKSNDDIMDFLEDFDGVDDIDRHDDNKDDSSDVETDYNGYEQDYEYAKDDRVGDELFELFEMINDDQDGYSEKEDMVNALLA